MAYENRQLHVEAKYASYADLSPSKLLQDMRSALVKKYKSIAEGKSGFGAGSVAEAQTLQKFFQEIKNMSKLGTMGADTSYGIGNALMMKIIQNATKMGGYGSAATQGTHAFFRQIGEGEFFERELSNVIAATLNMAGANVKGKNLNFGTAQGNVGGLAGKADMMGALDSAAQGTFKGLTEQMTKEIQNAMKQANQYVTKAVSNKIDVAGLSAEYTFQATGTPLLDKVARLLNQATFTAKSYSSLRQEFVQKLKQTFYTKSNRSELHFGSTDSKRIYLDMMMEYAKIPYPVAVSLYYRILNDRRVMTDNLRDTMSRLRFIYELTGYGQTYLNDSIQKMMQSSSGMGAKYLIYNDPGSGNIYVVSTAQMIQEAMADFAEFLNGNESIISKSVVSGGHQFV